MGFVDRARRALGSTALKIAASSAGLGGLEGARMARRLANFTPSRAHINTLLSQTGKTILARVRFLARNNPYAASMIDCYQSTLVGSGFRPSWTLGKDEVTKREELQLLWSDWTEVADADGAYDFEGLLWLGASELYQAGEFFIRLRPRYLSDGLPVPLQLQFMPSEMLDVSHNDDLGNGNRIRQGIQFDAIGRRVAYHFWKEHPGDETVNATGDKTIVPAEQVIHVRIVKEASQIRGLSRLAPLIVPLWSLDCYEDAELERKRVAALFTAFITKGIGSSGGTIMTDGETKTANAEGTGIGKASLEPGAIIVTEFGEDVKTAAPADVGPNFEAFVYRAILKIAAGGGLPYTGVSGDPSRGNFSNNRSLITDVRRRFEGVQNHVMIFQLCRALIPVWLDQAVLAGAISLPGYNTDDPKTLRKYRRVRWIPDGFEWVDPVKDIEADAMRVAMRTKARSTIIEEAGDDPIEVDNKIAEDQARAEKLGIMPPVEDPRTAPFGTAKAPPKDEGNEDPNADPANEPEKTPTDEPPPRGNK